MVLPRRTREQTSSASDLSAVRRIPRVGALRIFWAALLTASGFLFSGFIASHFPVEFRAEATFLRTFGAEDAPLLVVSPHNIAEDLLRPELWPALKESAGSPARESVERIRRRLTVRREGVQPTSDRIVVGLSHRRPEVARREVDRLVQAYVEKRRQSPAQQRIAQRLIEAEQERRAAGRSWNDEQQRLALLVDGRRSAHTAQAAGAETHRVYKLESVATQAQLQSQLDRGRRRLAELIELYTAQHPAVAQLQQELTELERRCAEAAAAAGTLQKQADRAKSDHVAALEQCALREQTNRATGARRALVEASHKVDVLSASLDQAERRRTIHCDLSDSPASPARPCGLWRRRAAFLLGCAASCACGLSLAMRRSPG